MINSTKNFCVRISELTEKSGDRNKDKTKDSFTTFLAFVMKSRMDAISLLHKQSKLIDRYHAELLIYQHEPLENYSTLNDTAICETPKLEEKDMASKYKKRVKVGIDEAQKPIYKWACGNSSDELQQNIARIIEETASKQKKSNIPLWSEYAILWFETFKKPKLRKGTADKQKALLNKQVVPLFPGKHIDEITVYDVMEALNAKKDYSQSYVRDVKNMMDNIFKSAMEDGHISKNPMNSNRVINPSRKKTSPRKALSQENQADIIAHIPDLQELNDRRFVAFLMFSCLSPSEIYGLRWEDLDLAENTIHTQRGLTFSKGEATLDEPKEELRNRYVPIDPQLLKFLMPIQQEGFIFARTRKGHEGEHYTEQTHKRAWERIKKQINMHGMTPYEGRHTYATNMCRASVPMKVAVDMMGHVDERMLIRHYQHPDAGDLKKAGSMVSDMIAKIQPS